MQKRKRRGKKKKLFKYMKNYFSKWQNFIVEKYKKVSKHKIDIRLGRNVLAFSPVLMAQGFLVLAILLFGFVYAGNYFISGPKIDPAKVISGVQKVNAVPVVAGKPVKWLAIVDRNNINSKQHLLTLPKDAKNIKVKTVSENEVKLKLAAALNHPPVLTTKERMELAGIFEKLNFKNLNFSGFLNTAKAGLADIAKFFFADLEQAAGDAISQVVQDSNPSIIETPAETVVDLSNQAPVVAPEQPAQPAEQPVSQEPSILETTTPADQPAIVAPVESIEQTTTPADQPAVQIAEKQEDKVVVEYQTAAPQITEKNTDEGKQVTVSAQDQADQPPLTDVIAYTKIPEIYKVGQEDKIKIKWKNEGNQEVAFHAYDLNNNGKLDYVEWTVPHLSEQIFSIIFISKAFELDENQEIVNDIYEQTVTQDDTWATVPSGHYIRATFKETLTSERDITLYARSAGQASVDVYPVYTDADGNQTEGAKLELVNDGDHSDFSSVSKEDTYRILLQNLAQPTDVFDLKINGADVDVDWVVDPTTRYWVGGEGLWSDASHHWSNTSNGSPSAAAAPTTSDPVVFNGSSGSGTCTVDTSITVGTVNTTSSSINITINSGVTFAGTTFTLVSGRTVTNNGQGNFSSFSGTGTWTQGNDAGMNIQGTTPPGTLNASATGNTVNYRSNTASTTTIKGTEYYNLGVGATASLTSNRTYTLGGNVTVDNVLTIGQTANAYVATLATSSNTLTVAGSGTPIVLNQYNSTNTGAGNGNVTYTGSSATNVIGLDYGNLTINGAGTFTMPAGNYYTTGNLVITQGTLDASASGNTISIGGNVLVTGGTLSTPASTSSDAFAVAGNWEVSGTGTFTPNNGKVTLGGDSVQTITTTSSNADDFYNLDINNANNTNLVSDVTVNGSAAINTTFNLSTYTFNVLGNLTGNGSNIDASNASANLLIGGNLDVTGATLSAPAAADDTSFTVGGNWNLGVGTTFTTNNGQVTFASGTHVFDGSTSFYNLKISAPSTVTLSRYGTQTIGNDLTCTGSAGNLITINGQSYYPAAHFNGTQMTFADTNLVHGNSAESFAAWIKSPANGTGSGATIITFRGDDATGQRRELALNDGQNFIFNGYDYSFGTDIEGRDPVILYDGNWHLVGYRYEGANRGIHLYADGVWYDGTLDGDLNTSSTNVLIGMREGTGDKELYIQEAQYYNEDIGTTGFADLWNNGAGKYGSATGHTPSAYFHFTGNTNDSSTNATNGTWNSAAYAAGAQVSGLLDTSHTKATLSKASGTVNCDYLALTDSAATGGATWNAGAHSTGTNTSGWVLPPQNATPSVPVLVSPANATKTNDNTPTLSASYSDSDTGDVGTTSYGIATSAENCLAGTFVSGCGSTCTGASAETATNSANTTWTPGSSIGNDGTYYWCAQNNDGVATSAWTSMGNFVLDTAVPTTSDDYAHNNEWVRGDQTITLTPADATSGVAWTKYCTSATTGGCAIDDSNGTAYEEPILIEDLGTTYVRYASKDNAGNTQTVVEKVVKINSAPSVNELQGHEQGGIGGGQLVGGGGGASSPANVGSNVTFSITASDNEGDHYYLAVCKTNSITANNSAAPTCADGQTWCVSTSTASGSAASCDYTVQQGDAETNTYYAFMCDNNANSACSSSTQSLSSPGSSPFYVNHAPSFTAIADSPDPAGSGAEITFIATAVDSDVVMPDTVTLYVCKTNSFSALGCGGGEWCHSLNPSDSNPTCVYTASVSGEQTYYAFVKDNHSFQSASNPQQGTFTVDATAPSPTGFSPASGSTVSGSLTIAFTLNEAGNCKASTTDSDYDAATISGTDCTGDGTTSISCAMGTISASTDIYISCKDAVGNESTADNNTKLSYVVQGASQETPVVSGGGGGWVGPIIETVQQTPAQIAEELKKTAQKTAEIAKALLPEGKEKISLPPIAESVPEDAQPVFKENWTILPLTSPGEYNFAPLPIGMLDLANKFPQLEQTFTQLSITNTGDVGRMRAASLNLPTLSETVQNSAESSGQSLLTQMTAEQKAKMPTDVVFARMAGEQVDINVNVSVDNQGSLVQKIDVPQGKALKLAVKPAEKAESVKGYLIFKMRQTARANAKGNLLVPAVSAAELPAGQQLEPVLDEFNYTDIGGGVFVANVKTPTIDGEFEIKTVITYKNKSLDQRELRMVAVIDPEGYVFENLSGKEARVSNATVTLYWLNPATKHYEIWPAKLYQQENPQVTDKTGRYAFLVPQGYYYIKVEAKGFYDNQDGPFLVQKGMEIHDNIQLESADWLTKLFSVQFLLAETVVILLCYGFLWVYNLYKENKENKLKLNKIEEQQ